MNRTILILVVVGLVAAGIWYSIVRARPADVVSGTIEADQALVGSKVGGRVTAIHAQEGNSLKKDQLIVEFDPAETQARRDAQVAAVRNAEAVLAELEHGPRPPEIEEALKNWQSLKADAELARKNLVRTKELFESKVATAEDLDRDTLRLDALKAQAAAAEERHRLLVEGTRPEKIAQARADLEQLKARLDEAETFLREIRVVAPCNATLETLHVKVGDIVAPNRPVATLLLASPLWVRVYVREDWLGYIAVGDGVDVRVDSFPNQTFKGIVVQVTRKAEFTPRNVQTTEERARQLFAVKIEIPPTDLRLRAGMTAEATFPRVAHKK